jgi:hypothetical protein
MQLQFVLEGLQGMVLVQRFGLAIGTEQQQACRLLAPCQ